MFRAILFTQWKWSRPVLAVFTVIAFAIPVVSAESRFGSAGTAELLAHMQMAGVFYPFFALVLGLGLAVTAWSADRTGRHVYALSLPLPRWQLVLYRFGAGAALLLVPLLALWVGALLASATAVLPPGIRAYPSALALRFACATLVAFGLAFLVTAGSTRLLIILLSVAVLLIFVQVLIVLIGGRVDVIEPITNLLFAPFGPLSIFTGRWMLFDA
jgi:hypothetical protein